MLDRNGDIIEIFEWASQDTFDQAKIDPIVSGMIWPDFEKHCDMLTLTTLGGEGHETFPSFQRIDVITTTGAQNGWGGDSGVTC